MVICATEALLGMQRIPHPTAAEAFRWLARVLIGLDDLGILRVWTLLGDTQHGWSGWLNPLQDLQHRARGANRWAPRHERFQVFPRDGV